MNAFYRIILQKVMHKATWNGRLYKTDCNITVAVVDVFNKEYTVFCPECFPV